METKDEILAAVAAAGGAEWPIDAPDIARKIGYSDPAEVFAARWPSADPATQERATALADAVQGWNAATSIDEQHGVIDLLVHRLAPRSSRRAPMGSARRAAAYEARVDGLVSAWYVGLDHRAAGGTDRLYRNKKSGVAVRLLGSSRDGYLVFMGRRKLTATPIPTLARATAFAREVMRRQGDRT